MGRVFASPRTKYKGRPMRSPVSFVPKVASTKTALQTHPRHKEDDIVKRLVKYIRYTYPEVIVFADMAGFDLTDKQRMIMMDLRSEDGYPDVTVIGKSHDGLYTGFVIEVKAEGVKVFKKDGTLRKQSYKRVYWVKGKKYIRTGDHLQEQYDCIQKFRRLGFHGGFGIGYDACVRFVDGYFGKPQQSSLPF